MPDLIRILKCLASEGVDFVVVGGFAAMLHGNDRVTRDVDLCVALSRSNLGRFANAVNPLEPRLRIGGPRITLDDRPLGGAFSSIFTEAGQIDVINELSGADSVAEIFERAVTLKLGTFDVKVAHIDDLIAMKEAAGRPHDLQDAANLRWLRDETARRAALSPDE